MSDITSNQREIIKVKDSVSGVPFGVKGNSADGSINVNVTAGGGAGTQYAEGTTTSPGTGTLAVARYKATPPSLTDGELYGLQLDSAGNLKITGSISVGGTTDNSAYTAGTSTGTPSMGFYHSVIDTVTDGRAATVAITSKRAMMVNLQTSAGAETGIAATPLQVSLANTAANATAVKVDGSAVTQPVSGTFWQATQPISAASLPLPTGAATAAKQPALGTAGTASSDVITIQGIASMTAVKVDGSAVTQPVSGTVSANATLSAETTKVIGVVRTADGSGNLLTSTGSALDVNIKTSAASNISTNLAQVNGVTTLAGNGASGTGAQRVTIASDSTGQVAPAANSTATGTSVNFQSALTNTKIAVNASAGNLYGYHIYNSGTAVAFVQFFNVASASVTLGTTTPNYVVAVPAGGWADAQFGVPMSFGTAMTIAATSTSTGSTAPGSTLMSNIIFK